MSTQLARASCATLSCNDRDEISFVTTAANFSHKLERHFCRPCGEVRTAWGCCVGDPRAANGFYGSVGASTAQDSPRVMSAELGPQHIYNPRGSIQML